MSSVLCEDIYSYFAVIHGTKSTTSRKTKKRPLHNRSLKEVEKQKGAAKKELRLARRSGSPAEVVDSLATKFISLVRTHSKLKKVSNARLLSREVKAARKKCHRDFKQCAREVLDSGSSQSHPSFGSEAATTFFSEVYHSQPKGFIQPDWIPTPPPPGDELDCSPFTESELASIIKKMKARSSPSPFDRIGYSIFKKCPSLLPALVLLFNTCWAQSSIPEGWKCAAIKLIPKSSASEDANNPANFRPIALTPCVWASCSLPFSGTVGWGIWLRTNTSTVFTSEGILTNCAWLYGTPSQTVINPGRGSFQSQICGSLLVGFGQCLRQHTSSSD